MTKTEIQEKIVADLKSPIHGLLTLAPRIGKTKIAIDIIKKEKPKTVLWVTPSTILRDIDIPKEFQTWKANKEFDITTIICYPSLLTHEGDYDLIILDEYQDLTPANSTPLFNKRIKYKTIIGLSGTHPRHREKLKLYSELGLEILSYMSIDQAVENKLIANYDIEVIEIELNDRIKNVRAGSKDKPFMQTEKDSYSYQSQKIAKAIAQGLSVPKFVYLNRMRFLYNLKSKQDFAKKFLTKLKGRTLIFAGSIAQIEELTEYTYHSKTNDKYLTAFKEGTIDTLGLVNSGGIGHTFMNVDNLLIVQVNSDQKGDATQKICRSLVLQGNYRAKIYILCVINTVDEVWKNNVLESFNTNNVEHISYKKYE